MDYEDFEEPLPPWAVAKASGKLEVGLQLFTKDGRRRGNAVVIGNYMTTFYMEVSAEIWEVMTDMGSIVKLEQQELHSMFYLGDFIMDVAEAIRARDPLGG